MTDKQRERRAFAAWYWGDVECADRAAFCANGRVLVYFEVAWSAWKAGAEFGRTKGQP